MPLFLLSRSSHQIYEITYRDSTYEWDVYWFRRDLLSFRILVIIAMCGKSVVAATRDRGSGNRVIGITEVYALIPREVGLDEGHLSEVTRL